jgi:predicted RNA-binding protein with PIN domain
LATRPAGQSEELIVDGYNLLRAAPLLCRLEAVGLQAARQALERALGRYARRCGAHVVVVYDGDGQAGAAAAAVHARAGKAAAGTGGWVDVRFSRVPENADEVIKQEIQHRHGAGYLRVITSDREIRRHARRHRVASTAAADFVRELEEPPPPASPAPLPPPPELDPDLSLSPAEVDAWERLFRERPSTDPGTFERG